MSIAVIVPKVKAAHIRGHQSIPSKGTPMPRLATPASIETSPVASRPLLEAVEKQLGVVPNLFRLVGNSPAGLEGFLGLMGALSKGQLEAATRTRIALAVAEINRCDYCLSAHTYLGRNLAKLSDAEMAANRDGGSTDPRAAVAVRFAKEIVRTRGNVSDADVNAVKQAIMMRRSSRSCCMSRSIR